MEYQQKMLLVTAALVAIALYIMFTLPVAAPPAGSAEAEALLVKSAAFGKGLGDYQYSYSETTDGYRNTYTLTKSNGSMLAEIQNPLSTKRIYMLQNDTIFCIRYPVNETCASIHANEAMRSYVGFVRSKFFNDTNIEDAEDRMEELLSKGYAVVEADMENASVGSFSCTRVEYTIDYSNITVGDAGRYGIGELSPKVYDVSRCIDSETGLPYETVLRYNDSGIAHNKTTRVLAFKESGVSGIVPPSGLGGDAISVFGREREQQVKLSACYTGKSGEERDKCVADIAFKLRRTDLCSLAGTKKDVCLLSVVSVTKDTAICASITNITVRDSCYVELAGAYKDTSYCAYVIDPQVAQSCRDEVTNPPADDTGTSSTVDIGGFIDYVEGHEGNESQPQ